MQTLIIAFLFFLLLLAVVGLATLGFFFFNLRLQFAQLETDLVAAKGQYQTLFAKHNDDANKWNESSTALKGEVQRLAKWKKMADAEVKAIEMAHTAQLTLEKANSHADYLVSTAQQKANSVVAIAEQRATTQITSANAKATALVTSAEQQATARITNANNTAVAIEAEAKEKAKALKAESQAFLDSVTMQTAKIYQTANKKAEEIAGTAYEAMKNAVLYQQTVQAMKNIIDGYGDRYIIPEQSLMDDLAEDFSHTQAGIELKRARDCTKIMGSSD